MKILGKSLLLILGVLFFTMFGFAWRDIQRGGLPPATALKSLADLVTGAKPQVSATDEFKTAFNRIRTEYYKPVDPDKLKYAGIEGLMSSLGDPHTIFLEKRAAQEFTVETTGNFVGIGAKLTPQKQGAKVAVIFDDGPAEKVGLKVGDIVTGVDGKSVAGTDIDDIVQKIRGKEGSIVTLTVVRPGQEKPFKLVVERAKVTTPTVEGYMLPNSHIGYLNVTIFSEVTPQQFDSQLAKLEKNNLHGLILDMRDDPGGLLETAKELLSRFVEDALVVTMKGRDGQQEVHKTYSGLKHDFHYPVVVLINEDSASAAEIFSGVLQDYKLATLVGEHSYGKASVQNVTNLIDGSSAKITIARYYLPSERNISRKVDEYDEYVSGGLEPDVKVEMQYPDPKKRVFPGDPSTDPQIAKAMEVIQAKQK